MEAPQNPAGDFVPEDNLLPKRREQLITEIEAAPVTLRATVAGLSKEQLDTKYRNWTIRQIVHHLADSHTNGFIRFKLALTEDEPTIKPYDESRCTALPDARAGDIQPPLTLLDGLHACWSQVLRSMNDQEFSRCYFHPEFGKTVSLNSALCLYAWHGKHHTAQIRWVREQHGW